MGQATVTRDGIKITACDCECHEVGMKYKIMHCAPCCDVTYESYITKTDGIRKVDEELFAGVLNAAYLSKKKP